MTLCRDFSTELLHSHPFIYNRLCKKIDYKKYPDEFMFLSFILLASINNNFIEEVYKYVKLSCELINKNDNLSLFLFNKMNEIVCKNLKLNHIYNKNCKEFLNHYCKINICINNKDNNKDNNNDNNKDNNKNKDNSNKIKKYTYIRNMY
jgi:hypothetical protein